MYRSRSTSSVYAGAPYEFKPETPPAVNNRLHLTYEPEVRSRRPEEETSRSMTSAAKLPTHVGRRPLPKALLPKAARGGPTTPPSIGGTVFRISNQGSRSPHTPSAKTPSVNWVSGSSALRDSGYGSLSSDLSRVGLSAPVSSPSPPFFGGTERGSTASRTDDHSAGKTFRFHSMEETPSNWWHPPGNIRPLRRRDPVVEDSIYPILKAALAKDREPEEDRRTEDKRTEEEVVRDAFRRPNTFLSPSTSSPVLSSRNIYSSSSADDVFASTSEAAAMTSSGVGNHSKSKSEVVISNRLSQKHSGTDAAQVDCPSHLSNSLHTLTVERDERETWRVSRSPESDKILADSAHRTFEIKNRRNPDLDLVPDPDLDLGLGLDDEYPVRLTTPENPGLSPLPLPSPPLGFRDADFSTGATSSSTTFTSPPFRGTDVICLDTPPVERRFNQPPIADNSSKISLSFHQDGERKAQSDESRSSVTREEEEEETEEGEGRELVVDIVKGPVGVGFCIEGGRGSLSGDRPITVKRVFKGGSGEASVALFPGDELVSVGGQSMDAYSHFDAWKFIKALPNGNVQMTIRRRRVPPLTLPSPNILSPPVGFKAFA